MGLRTWWRARHRRRAEQLREDVENRIQLELRRAAYGSEAASSVSVIVLAHRLSLSPSDLQPLLDDLLARKLIVPSLSTDSYRIRDWSPDTVDPRAPKGK